MSDTFRKVYKELPKNWQLHILGQKEAAEELEQLFSVIKSREMSLALTHLETSLMWATKAIVLHAEKE